jgi:hypothetical protein
LKRLLRRLLKWLEKQAVTMIATARVVRVEPLKNRVTGRGVQATRVLKIPEPARDGAHF